MSESWELKAVRDRLRAPFPKEQIGKLPATGRRPELDYVGHAAVTDRLNLVVPDWSYTIDADGRVDDGYWIRGTMTIGGVSRPEFGDGPDPKQALGNFIRRAAMRFGVALDLWSREELEASPAVSDEPQASAPAGDTTSPAVNEPVAERGVASSEPNAPAPRAGDTKPGEVRGGPGPVGRPQPPSSGFPIAPEKCDHKTSAGRWVKWKPVPAELTERFPTVDAVCPKCGTPRLVAMEGTTADLGPA